MVKVRNCGVRRGVVLSSLAGQGIIRLGDVKCSLAEWCRVLCGKASSWLGVALRSWVMNGEPRHGLSWRGRVLRGRARYGEVLHSKVRYGAIR